MMTSCDNCGRENPPGVFFCNGCGTELREPEPGPPRHLTASDRKRGWRAAVIAGVCSAIIFPLMWKHSDTMHDIIAQCVGEVGLACAVWTLWELRQPDGQRFLPPTEDK
jgi:hypothetical protein